MKIKKLIAPVILAGFVFSMFVVPSFAEPGFPQQKDQKEAKQPAAKIFIPKEVRDVMLQGLQARQVRQDIPFSIFKSTILPAQTAFYIVPFLKIKNADLPFAPVAVPQTADAAAAPAQPKVKATFDVFLQFHKLENGVPTQIVKEVYVPTTQEQDAATYDPNKEEWYTVAYPLLPGNYLLAIAVTTHDLKKIGTQYFEFSLPDLKSFTKELETTSVFFLKEYKELPAAETVAELHKGYFRYSIAQFTPSVDNVLAFGEATEVFFLVLGAQPNEQNKYDIECQYEVKEGDKDAIKFAPTKYETPFISQPLFMKQTLLIKDKDGKERQEGRDLPAGNYTFTIKLTDKVSGRTCTKAVDFTVK